MDKRAELYINWLKNWLTTRRAVFLLNYKEAHPLNYMMPSISSDIELDKQLGNINNLGIYIGKTGFNKLKEMGFNADYNIRNDKYYDESKFGSKNGFFDPRHNLLFFTNAGLPKAFIHELTHALAPRSATNYLTSPQNIKIAKILLEDPYFKNNKELVIGKYKQKDSKNNIIYKYVPDEVYARLMLLRHDFNFDPNHKWTEKEVSEQRKKWDQKNGSHYYFDKEISDKTLTRLLNEVAFIEDTPQDSIKDNYLYSDNLLFYAKKGTKLFKRNR